MENMTNPYINRGEPVYGERLVGRDNIRSKIINRLSSRSHFSIVGLPRMGKTSIAKDALSSFCQNNNGDVTCCYLSLDALRDPSQIFLRILYEFSDDIEINSNYTNHDLAYELFIKYFRKRNKSNVRSVIVLDEMDAVIRDEFPDAQLFISRLREIANEYGRYGISFIFISRRSLDIIQGSIDCSTLAGLCEVIYIKPLDYQFLNCLVDRSKFVFTQMDIDFLWELTGGHPFLSEVIMCEAFDLYTNKFDIDLLEKAYSNQVLEFTNQYRQLSKILSHDNIFHSMCELVVGPQWRDISQHSTTILKQYGLINFNNSNNCWDCFSLNFKDYLVSLTRTEPTWDLLRDTEKSLRTIVKCRLESRYGSDWFNKLQEKNEKFAKKASDIITLMQKEKKRYGDYASDAYLDLYC